MNFRVLEKSLKSPGNLLQGTNPAVMFALLSQYRHSASLLSVVECVPGSGG